MKSQKKKPSAKSKKKPAPVVKKEKKAAQKDGGDAASIQQENLDLNLFLGDPTNPDKRAILPVKQKIREDLSWLFSQAIAGDKHALRELVRLSIWTTQLIKKVTDEKFDLAKGIAEEESFWPVAVSASKEFPYDIDGLRKKLEIGKRSTLPLSVTRRFSGKWFTDSRALIEKCLLIHNIYKHLNYFANGLAKVKHEKEIIECDLKSGSVTPNELRVASELVQHLTKLEGYHKGGCETHNRLLHEFSAHLSTLLGIAAPAAFTVFKIREVLKEGLRLPPLSAETREGLFLWIVKLIMSVTRGQPEKNFILQGIGKSGGLKSYRQKANKSGQSDEEPEAMKKKKPMVGSEESNQWDTAYRMLWSAYNASIPQEFAAAPKTNAPKKPKSSCEPITTVLAGTVSLPP